MTHQARRLDRLLNLYEIKRFFILVLELAKAARSL
jgi:hypothetical protein